MDGGGLWCDNERVRQGVVAVNIAYTDLKAARAATRVPVCRQGTLADYVPFYFAPRSPMLYVIHRGGVAGYAGGQEPVLHLFAKLDDVRKRGLSVTFTEGHAAIPFSRFFEDWRDLDKIDWAVMQDRYWNNTDEDGDRKRRRQAEFLVHHFFPWDLIRGIGVRMEDTRLQVERLIARAPHRPEVHVVPGWYY